MQQENKDLGPKKTESGAGSNPPPAGGTPGEYQQAQPKVDNFSAPAEGETANGGESGDSFEMPSNQEMKTPETQKEPSQEQSLRTPPSSEPEEPEDVFAKPEQPPPPPVQPGPEAKPGAPQPKSDEQKLNIPQEKKGHGCLWGILIFVVIILLVAGAIFVNEMGIINLGIEKYYGAIRLETLWKGLPSDAKLALADSAKKMTGKSFNLEGSSEATLTIEGTQSTSSPSVSPTASPTPSPTETPVQGIETTGTTGVVQTDIAALINEGLSFKGEVKIRANVESPDKFEVIFSTATIGSDQATLLGLGEMIDLTLVDNGNDIYLKNEDLRRILNLDKEWIKIVVPGQEKTTTKETLVSDLISSGERIGWEKVNGVSCYVYEVKMSGTQLENFLAKNRPNLAFLAENISFSQVKFYLGKRDHLMHKLEISSANISTTTTIKNKISLIFSNIGSKVSVNIPSSDVVAEKNWADVRNNFVSGATVTPTPTPTQGTPEERDKQRKSDLKKIQDALLAYKVQNGKYPSTSGATEKTKDATSNLKNSLVPKYLDSLPVDPENDKYYYGYKSDDGTKCEIWSILENTNDTDGESYQGFWIYKLRGN